MNLSGSAHLGQLALDPLSPLFFAHQGRPGSPERLACARGRGLVFGLSNMLWVVIACEQSRDQVVVVLGGLAVGAMDPLGSVF